MTRFWPALAVALCLVLTGCLPIAIGAAISSGGDNDLVQVLRATDQVPYEKAGSIGLVASASGQVMSVVDCSPADEAGIVPEDRLLEIDGRPVHSEADLLGLAGPPGIAVSLKIQHETEVVTLMVPRVMWWSLFDAECETSVERRPGF